MAMVMPAPRSRPLTGLDVIFFSSCSSLPPASFSSREALLGVLAEDPRPPYQENPDRVYGMAFGGLEVRFTAAEGLLTVRDVEIVSPGKL